MNNILRRQTSRLILWAGSGFALTFSLCLLARPAGPASRVRRETPSPPAPSTVSTAVKTTDQPIREWLRGLAAGTDGRPDAARAGLNPETMLSMVREAGGMDNAEMARLMEDLDTHPVETRELARALLIRWSQRDPGASVLWMLAGLENGEKSLRFSEVLATWAARDTTAFREWCVRNLPLHERARYYAHVFTNALEEVNSIEAARLHEEAGSGPYSSGFGMNRWMQTISDVPGVLKLAVEKSGFAEDSPTGLTPEEKKRINSLGGWRRLFDAAAARLNDTDPAAFQQWLATQPEIVREKGMKGVLSNAERKPAPVPVPDPTPPASLSDPRAMPSPDEFTMLYRDWAQWRSRAPKAADAFLQNSVWPEERKFRARITAAMLPAP